MLESIFQSIHILVEVIGFGIIIFKGGNFIGSITTIVIAHGTGLESLEKKQEVHSKEDKELFKEVSQEITNLKVALASSESHGKN